MNKSVILAPHSGYVFEWHGCGGVYDRNYGAVASSTGRLQLSFTFKRIREGFQGIAPELVVVRWGARRYLIPADDLIGFCNEVNQGDEPRTDIHGEYLLRLGDENKQAQGSPELPPEYRDCILSKPVAATVMAVGSPTSRDSIADWKFLDTKLTLDAGKKQGLKVGMELIVVEPRDLVESVQITSVEDNRAEAIMTQIGEENPGPKAGWRLSTQGPWNAQKAK